MTPAPHPWRCETCEYRTEGVRLMCRKVLEFDPKSLQIGISYYTAFVGCASHSSTTSAEKVLEELEERLKEKIRFQDDHIQYMNNLVDKGEEEDGMTDEITSAIELFNDIKGICEWILGEVTKVRAQRGREREQEC